jgi:hypothetical protein
MSGIVKVDPNVGIAAVDINAELPAIFTLAKALTKAGGFIPQHLKNEGEIAAVILAGRELGLPPMTSLRSLSLIKGKVTLAADVQLALMVKAGAKHRWLSDGSNGVAKLELTRPGYEPHTSTFTLEDAQKAGLASQENYKKHQGAMLRARAVSAAARAYMPDVLAGCYVPGELEEDQVAKPTAKRGKTLDDVAQDIAEHVEPAKLERAEESIVEYDEATGEVIQASTTYTLQNHLDALPHCSQDALGPWFEELQKFQMDAALKRKVWAGFSEKCAEYELAPEQFKKGGSK